MLPLIKKIKLLDNVFPTAWQAVIFRNYGLVSADKIAKTLSCDEERVRIEAERLGLADVEYQPAWEERGYITIIRNNWYLLPYSQILTLLDITEARLQFILEKEDFLWVKLGEFKPECAEVRYTPLSNAQKQKTEEIASVVLANAGQGVKPFSFFDEAITRKARAEFGNGSRIAHGYLVPCGDVFKEDDSLYLPDALLEEYQNKGINGLFFHGLLSTLSPYPFDTRLSEGYQLRREKLNGLIARCKKFNIKVYLYLNEPRELPQAAWGKYAHLIGRKENGSACLCLENEQTQEYLYTAAKDLLLAAPDLGGFMTITMSENPTHCNYKPHTNCPVCKGISPENSAAKVNNILMQAIRDGGTKAELIANLWGWSPFMDWTEAQTLRGVELLDKDISVLSVSEYDLDIQKGGVKSRIIDYSIGNIGPSEITKKTLTKAREFGHKTYAKIQINNSWECSAVPYLPVFDLTYRHLKNLQAIGVENYLLTWTLGGYPSPVMDLIADFSQKKDGFDLCAWYDGVYGTQGAQVHRAVEKFCQGFEEYPFSIDNLYFAPKTLGGANLWEAEASEKNSTMVCFAFDDYENWIKPYPYEIYCAQYGKLLDSWRQGLALLDGLSPTKEIEELRIFALGAYLHLETDLLQAQYSYYKKAGKKEVLLPILLRAREGVTQLLGLVRKNACIAYETSNHYFYTQNNLLEKLLNLDALIETAKKQG